MAQLPGWRHDAERKAIARSFRFSDFAEAFAFMTRVALAAEKADHHPDWSNSWNRVVVDIVSHASAGVTARCVALAEAVDRLAG